MAQRHPSIAALIARTQHDLTRIEGEYNGSLAAKQVSDSLRIDIKNQCENLRSILDYLAHDIRDRYCPPPEKDRFYFPILPDKATFDSQVDKWFPGLRMASPQLVGYLESEQPFQPGHEWLGSFNRVNNENKHANLVEQTRSEAKETRVSGPSGQVSWGQGVTFGQGVSIMGVPIDPRTQLPVPSNLLRVEQITWVDFRFAGEEVSALRLLKQATAGTAAIAAGVQAHL